MNKSNIIALSAALVAILAVIGISAGTFAADDQAQSDAYPLMERMGKMNDRFANLTDEAKADLKAGWEENRAEHEAQREAVRTALDAGDYDHWVEAVGENAPILEKVNPDNFDRLVEAHSLREQARTIMEDELGIEKPGFGMRGMRGMHGFCGQIK